MTNSQRFTIRRWLRRLALLAVAAPCVWLGAAWLVVHQLTRRMRPIALENMPTIEWASIAKLHLTTSDGHRLGAWYIAGKSDRPTVVLLHGNGGSKISCLVEAEMLSSHGCGVLLVTQRAHGESSGDFNDFGYSGRHDVIAAVDWLADHQPNQPVVVWGQSLGSAAAAYAAQDLGERVSGYIIECPYQDLRTATWNRMEAALPPGFDYLAYAGLQVAGPLVLGDIST